MRIFLVLGTFLLALPSPSAEVRPTDTDTPEHLVSALYDVISGPANHPRDWMRFRALFAPEGRMVAFRKKPAADGKTYVVVTPEQYIERNDAYMAKEGFTEHAIANRVEEFGNIATVWSSYEAVKNVGDKTPLQRGINTFTLLRTTENGHPRWMLLQILWDDERPDLPVPAKYLKPAKP